MWRERDERERVQAAKAAAAESVALNFSFQGKTDPFTKRGKTKRLAGQVIPTL
jgi:hypothetical protein